MAQSNASYQPMKSRKFPNRERKRKKKQKVKWKRSLRDHRPSE